MNTSPLKKLLVLLDGSERSLETVRYLVTTEEFHKASIVLFHVFNAVPECYWDLAKEPKSIKVVPSMLAWQSQQKKEMQAYMETARDILLEGGFAAKSIRIHIHNRKNGIARDILAEARKAYDAVVMRRRGFTLLPEIIMGSVATKIIQRLNYRPIIIAGLRPPGSRALLAFDGSPGAFRAVEFTGRVIKNNATQLRLLHVLRGDALPSMGGMFAPKECIDDTKARMEKFFQKAIHRLTAIGVAENRITCRIEEGARSRAAAIAAEAAQGDYGTIIVGRRGQSRVRSFFMGRVGDKLIHLARERTIWVIN
ncbi:MAG: universal stress protein [Pseudomonadota bacterium]